MNNADEADSLLRELAASPPREPPARRVSAIAVSPLNDADELDRLRARVNRFDGKVAVRSDGVLLVTMRSVKPFAAASATMLSVSVSLNELLLLICAQPTV